MCRLASFFHKSDVTSTDVAVSNLASHDATEKALKLNRALWFEGHYLPNGTIEARVPPEAHVTADECVARIRKRWMRFADFFMWALRETSQTKSFNGSLDLRGCDLKAVTLPTSISGSLDLRGCDLKGVTLPTSTSGSLDLRGCNLKGVTLPTSIGVWLDLNGCDLKGVTLPDEIKYKIIH